MEIRYGETRTPVGIFTTRYFRAKEPLIYVEWTNASATPTATSTQVGESIFVETDVEIVKQLRTSACPNIIMERQFFTPIRGLRPGEELTFRFQDTKL